MTQLPVQFIEQVITDAFRINGLRQKHVNWMVNGLLGPSLRGIDSHGIRLLQTYLSELQGGRSKARPDFRFTTSASAAISMDADQGLGIVAGYEATERAILKAKQFGIAAVAVKNSNHFGAASNYTLAAAQQGLMCLSFSNSDALVAPHGGAEKVFGTNPISFAAPAQGDEIYCLDMATSQVSYSKILNCLAKGEATKDNWAVNVDHEQKSVGALLPLGGYKGQGLAMMVSILSGVLNGGPDDMDMSHLYCAPYDEPRQVGHFIIAINIDAFTQPVGFRQRLSRLMARVRQSETGVGERILVAGDLEKESKQKREKEGIPVSQELAGYFDHLATMNNQRLMK